MITLLRWLFPDRRTDEQKATDAIRKQVEEYRRKQNKRKRDWRNKLRTGNYLKVVR